MIKWSIRSLVLVSAASILSCQLEYGLGHINSVCLYHPIRLVWVCKIYFSTVNAIFYEKKIYCSLPWNQESFFGYVGEIFVDVIICGTFVILYGQFSLLFISLCIHFFTFNEMFASFVKEVDNSADEMNKTELIRKLIEFHIDIKGYVCVTQIVFI